MADLHDVERELGKSTEDAVVMMAAVARLVSKLWKRAADDDGSEGPYLYGRVVAAELENRTAGKAEYNGEVVGFLMALVKGE